LIGLLAVSAHGYVGAYLLVCLATPAFLRRIGELSRTPLIVGLATAALMVAIIVWAALTVDAPVWIATAIYAVLIATDWRSSRYENGPFRTWLIVSACSTRRSPVTSSPITTRGRSGDEPRGRIAFGTSTQGRAECPASARAGSAGRRRGDGQGDSRTLVDAVGHHPPATQSARRGRLRRSASRSFEFLAGTADGRLDRRCCFAHRLHRGARGAR